MNARIIPIIGLLVWLQPAAWSAATDMIKASRPGLPRVRVGPDGRTFVTDPGKPFVPFGVNYYRPGTGWAPQVWKQFDREATRQDFARMRDLGINCVRVFLSYGSFYQRPGELSPEGLAKFDRFLALAEAAGIYVHPTGPDHWEGTPSWARGDRFSDETLLRAQEDFWRLFAARYRGRSTIFAYDLLNEPAIGWDSAGIRRCWNQWIEKRYGTVQQAAKAWRRSVETLRWMEIPAPEAKDSPRDPVLLDYQRFREELADEWTRRQAVAIKAADPHALVTVGFIQWTVPALLPGLSHYAAFRPVRQARFLDFLEIHFYPLEHGFYEYGRGDAEARNLSYLESVVAEVARQKKPVVLAEFGWYGGGRLTIDQGQHPAASEAEQAQWCRHAVEATAGLAVGWLNWGFYDHPESRDVSQLTGLLTTNGTVKAWGREFKSLAARYHRQLIPARQLDARPVLDWDLCLTSQVAENEFRDKYFQDFQAAPRR